MTTQFINPRRQFVVSPAITHAPAIVITIATTFPASNLLDPDALAHVASIFAPSIEDDSWLLAMPARSSERWHDWMI